MAFVNQAKRNLNTANSNLPEQLGPGAYVGHNEYRFTRSAAPFNTVIQRQSVSQEKNPTPGPGTYYFEQPIEGGQKVVLTSGDSQVKILEVPKPQSNFKSSSKRFDSKIKDFVPGPGTYIKVETKQQRQSKQVQQSSTSPNIIDHLMKINRYQSIPSIPHKHQVYGYTEKDNNELELNKNPEPNFKGIKDDQIGPGQYGLKDTFEINKNKGPTWHKSKVTRLGQQKDRQNSVGPGQYDNASQPSVGFSSKSQRSFDQRKGQVAQQFLMERLQQTQKKYKAAEDDPESEEIEFIDDTTPGPGHYNPISHSISTTASTQSRMLQRKEADHAFGSQCKRFKQEVPQVNPVGPGNYEVLKPIGVTNSPTKHPPFLSSNTRFETNLLDMKPGPQTYNPKLTLGDKLTQKVQKGPLGNFGSNQVRFGQSLIHEEPPGPGQYNHERPYTQEATPNVFFKSRTKRDPFLVESKNTLFPPPGAYVVENYTIEKQTRVEKEEDQDLAIKKPPFNSSVTRFKEPKVYVEEEDEETTVPQSSQKNINELFRKKPERNAAFNVKSQRFQYQGGKEEKPGPGQYYDTKNNTWNKRTYNILFAEI